MTLSYAYFFYPTLVLCLIMLIHFGVRLKIFRTEGPVFDRLAPTELTSNYIACFFWILPCANFYYYGLRWDFGPVGMLVAWFLALYLVLRRIHRRKRFDKTFDELQQQMTERKAARLNALPLRKVVEYDDSWINECGEPVGALNAIFNLVQEPREYRSIPRMKDLQEKCIATLKENGWVDVTEKSKSLGVNGLSIAKCIIDRDNRGEDFLERRPHLEKETIDGWIKSNTYEETVSASGERNRFQEVILRHPGLGESILYLRWRDHFCLHDFGFYFFLDQDAIKFANDILAQSFYLKMVEASVVRRKVEGTSYNFKEGRIEGRDGCCLTMSTCQNSDEAISKYQAMGFKMYPLQISIVVDHRYL